MRHEARLLAYAPMTAVFLAGFLLSTAAAVFLVGDFYASDVASADLLWTFLPWAALVFVPALAMNAFPDAPGDRSLELVCSLPLPRSSIVAGKWLAGTGILTLALAGTLPFAATIAYLGAPDWGVMAAGYLAALLLVASFFAVALAASACAREPIAAYVLGVGALFVILAAGWDVAGRYARGSPLEPLLSFAAGLSPKLWLDRAATGRLELGAILAAALIVAGALAISRWALEVRGGGRLGQTLTPPALAAAAVLLLLAALVPKLAGGAAHLDLTAEREFTLHAESVAVAREVPPGTVVDFYWSSRDASVPASIRLHARRARDLLRGLAASSGGRLRLVEHDVEPDSDEETRALAAGVRRIALSAGGSFVLGAAVHQGARKTSISYFDIGRDRLLEHDIAAALAGLTRGRTPRVAVISPLLLPRNIEQPREGLAIIEELKRTYDTAIVPHFADKLPDDLDAVIVIGASILKRSMLHAIDQHVMRGKGLIVLADPFNRFNQASDAVVPEPSPEVNDISDLLAAWGLTFDGKAVIGDRQLAAQVAGDGERQLAYPFWLQVRKAGLSARHRATAGLAEVLFVEPGAWEITRAGAAEPLVSTTAAAGALARTDASGKSVEELAAAFEPDGRVRVLAAAIVGPLASAFTAAPDDAPPSSPPHLTRSPASVPVFAVADVDWLFDPAGLLS
jgi:ABC-2 type transport system permease protein